MFGTIIAVIIMAYPLMNAIGIDFEDIWNWFTCYGG